MGFPELLKITLIKGDKQENFLLSLKKEFVVNHTFDDVKTAIFKRNPELLNADDIRFYWIGESLLKWNYAVIIKNNKKIVFWSISDSDKDRISIKTNEDYHICMESVVGLTGKIFLEYNKSSKVTFLDQQSPSGSGKK